MKSINIEMLMGHSIGISDSYYKITEDELLTRIFESLRFFGDKQCKPTTKKYDNIELQNQNNIKLVKGKLFEKENEIKY